MSTTPTSTKNKRHIRSTTLPSAQTDVLQHPQNSNHFSSFAGERNTQSTMAGPTTPPRTPRKNSPPVTHPKSNTTPAEHATKHKPKNKNRPKNVNVSPAVTRDVHRTSPVQTGSMSSAPKPITTPHSTAYAGSTFHASPAPSALPIPSFYSKSVPESPVARGLLQKRDFPSRDGNEPVKALQAHNNGDLQREESPLDFLFKLDREEKERARSASATQHVVQTSGPFLPPLPNNSRTPPARTPQAKLPNSQRNSGGMFPFEMDSPNSSRSPYGPAFSTPYSERINAARASSQTEIPQHSPSTGNSQSDLLKRYLFDNHLPSQTPLQQPLQPPAYAQRDANINGNNVNRRGANPPQHTPRNNGRFSGLRQEVTPTKTPTRTPDKQAQPHEPPVASRLYRRSSTNNHSAILGAPFEHGNSFSAGYVDSAAISNHNTGLNGLESHLRNVLKLGAGDSSTTDQ